MNYLVNKVKQRIRPVYYALKATSLYGFYNASLNLFFRRNNLLWALILSKIKGNSIVFGRNIVFKHCKFEIRGTGNAIVLGNDVFCKHCKFEVYGSENSLNIQDNCGLSGLRVYMCSGKNELVVGKNTNVNACKEQPTLFNPCQGGGIYIGDNCLFSNNIELHTTDYHKIYISEKRENETKDIYIGSHCWIGLQTLILKGSRLANNSIVGARTLLNKQYDKPNTLIVGNPARIVKENVQWVV